VRTFKFFVGDDKVDVNTSESPLLFTRPLEKPIEKKGEKAKVLFLMDASLTVSKVTGLERNCHCEERDSSLTLRNRLRNPGDCHASLAMTLGAQKDEGNQSQ
jgi:hypothetical protein